MSAHFECLLCKKFFDYESRDLFKKHLNKEHNTNLKQLKEYARQNLPEQFCLCGCGGVTSIQNFCDKRNKFLHGHSSRVTNNWGHNENAQIKSKKSRKDMNHSWPSTPWNKGKSIKTDEKFAAMCKNVFHTDAYRQKCSKNMKFSWASGKIKPLSGNNHPAWKGGTSSIGSLCNANVRLYREWKFVALKKSNFSCERCGQRKMLHVHHSEIKMSTIIRKCAPEDADIRTIAFNEKIKWVNDVINWHVENMPPAIVLCKKCHNDEHPSLNFK